MAVTSSAGGNHYIPGIDGLRALAVLSVMIFHLKNALLPGGFAGVDVFFVISGFVVSRAMLNRSELGLWRYFGDFFARRFIRILPALLVCLTVTSLFVVLFIPESWLSATIDQVGRWAYFGASNFALVLFQDGYFAPRAEFNPFTHTWSLGVEEQFYLILPLVLLIWSVLGKGRGALAWFAKALLPLLALASLGVAFWLGQEQPASAYYLLPARFWELATGVMLYLALHQKPGVAVQPGKKSWLLWVGLILIALGFALADGKQFPFPWALLPVSGTALCLYALSTGATGAVQRLLASRGIAYIGKISYSLYLWHWPIYALLRWTLGLEGRWSVAALVLTFTCAALSYHVVEQPVRQSRWLQRRSPFVVVLAGVLIVYGALSLATKMFASRAELSLSVTNDKTLWYPFEHPIADLPAGEKPLAGRKMFVIGNSHAEAYSTMLREAADRLGVQVRKVPMGACNLGSVMINIGDDPNCQQQVAAVLADIERELAPGDLVFFASLRTYRLIDQWAVFDYSSILPYGDQPFSQDHPLLMLGKRVAEFENVAELAAARSRDSQVLGFDDTLAFGRSVFAKSRRQLALDEARTLVAHLRAQGLTVLFDAPKPVFQIAPYRCSDWFNRGNSLCALGPKVDRASLLALRAPIVASLEALAAEFNNVALWDPFPVLCPTEVCSVYDESGLPLFFDGDHLSAHGNRRLYPDFARVLLQIWHKDQNVESTP